ncbi:MULTISPECIES: GntR family transcriptional regulator [Geomicrobium]|uniref:DNA-binding transcriptional regulator YhcF (GntR family) n=1 Tax=Geomicrobium sediminis TaxID=1347788 RepID=A0ABS2PIQ9_9BACL|nr:MULTISPECIES: GntR family transcriptional regulator [Geomicrobium]MBM7634708.1 DNA-binding transcriptional regulator YhcF (GntR family) [Geomicrobium sediminis]GAJ98256.1 transcriptional regulator, GntR family [Geomicrobium sp. JCM 19055]GAK07709.1 transcriptional regulator, GntR family [Geomicrobium sp. JCM 19038]
MRPTLDDTRPIYLQIREMIEDEIIEGRLLEETQAPSTNQLVAFYKINPATILKGINQLVDAGILYKKRGVGMFVASGSKQQLLEKRKEHFLREYVEPMHKEAERLSISEDELHSLIFKRGGHPNED